MLSETIRITMASSLFVFANAQAHHSYSEYDENQIIEIEGTLADVALRNPHVIFTVEGVDENNQEISWRLESTSLNWLKRLNVPMELLEVGSRVKFAGWPSKRSNDRIYSLNMQAANGQEVLLFRTAELRWTNEALGFAAQEAQAFYQGGTPDDTVGFFHVWASDLDDRATSWAPTAPLALTKKAQDALAAFDPINDSTAKGCTPKGMPLPMSQPPPMELVDQGDTILLRMEEYETVRTIHMTAAQNPEAQPLTPLGYSVGRWEGKTLVVETTRLNSPYLNNTGVPLGANAKFVERFEPSEDGSRLNYVITITAPDSLIVPAEFTRSWVWRPGEQLLPFKCAEL